MIALFKQKSPANIVVLLIFGLLIKMPIFLYPKNIQATATDGTLYRYFLSLLGPTETNGRICAFVSFLLLYGHALLLNHQVNEYRMTTRQTFLPAMAYLLVTSLLPDWNYLSAPLVASLLVVWAFAGLFRLYNLDSAKGPVYNIGLVLGIASFIFIPSAAFILCMLIGMAVLKPFRLNEVVLLLLGVLTPYYFYSVYLFLNDKLSWTNVFPKVLAAIPDIQQITTLLSIAALVIIPFVIGAYYIQLHLRKMLIQVRKNWSIFLFYLLLALALPFLNSRGLFLNWVLMVPPFAAFHASAYLYPQKRLLPLLFFFLTVGFVLFQQYATDIWIQ